MEARTLILGGGRDARKIAEALLEAGGSVIVAAPAGAGDNAISDTWHAEEKAGKLEIIPVAGSVSCSGSTGRYRLTFSGDGPPVVRTVAGIILADDPVRTPNFALYGVAASNHVVSLSKAWEFVESGAKPAGTMQSWEKIAFITGLADESHPAIAEKVMRCALKLQQAFSRQTYIFTGNLKVAENGLEALYRQTKSAGTLYLKFTDTLPELHVDTNGRVTITYVDEIIRETFTLCPNGIVIDETLQPSAFSQRLSKQLKIDRGPDGFVQSDNVHRSTVFTNRKSVFVAGFSRSIQTEEQRQADAGCAALAVVNLSKKTPEELTGKAQINFSGQCVGCLTCLRICPYEAISLNSKIVVDPQACQGCGLCAAECPRFAIQISAPAGEAVSDRIPHRKSEPRAGSFKPAITAFCCSRSAKEAGDSASCMGYTLPQGLQMVEVPCAGSVSTAHLFSAFSRGADGVLVLTCHKGNCHSEYGNTYAHHRVEQVAGLLPGLGFETERLAFKTLAANMAAGFAETVNAFENTLAELGPSRLKAQDEDSASRVSAGSVQI